MKKRIPLRLIVFLLAVGLVSAAIGQVKAAEENEQVIYAGVYLDGVYVGGLTKDEAMKEYDKYIEGIESLRLTFTTSVGSYTTTLRDIGISVSVEDAVDEAMHYGRRGNILSRYREIKLLEEENVVLVPEKLFDEDKLKDKLENETQDIVATAKDASISRENGEFTVYPGVKGTTVKVEETIQAVKDLFAEEWTQKDVKLNAVVEEKDPQYTEEDFYMIDSVMGQYQTNYNQSQTSRSKNLSTGASKISGTVMMPGEQFSMLDTVTPFTEENGYADAGQYVNNELVEGLGGGICQVSTTLYNAVINAELKVDERRPHSLTVSYVERSRDAAIAEGLFDFKFTNDTEYPIYIEGYAGGGTISFAIYGHDTRPSNRTIEFESKTVQTYEPDDPEEIKDDTLEEGKTQTEQTAYTGYYCELWKHIYIDGELQESVLVNSSQYEKVRGKIRVGTKKKKDKDDKKKDKDDDDDDDDTGEEPADTPEEPSTEPTDTDTPVGLRIGLFIGRQSYAVSRWRKWE